VNEHRVPDCIVRPSLSDGPGGPADGEVDVWILDLDRPDENSATLSHEEQKRAQRLVKPRDQYRFRAAHRSVRRILGRYLDQAPASLVFEANQAGKPLLKATDRSHRISFNLAHSGRYGLLAVGGNREVGVDIEIERTLDDLVGVARQIMSPAEWQSFQSIQSDSAQAVFFGLWTRKEALLKAIGTGLLTDPRDLDLGLENGTTALLAFQGTVWSVTPLAICAPAKAAIAIEGAPARIRIFGPESELSNPPC
jgi:4'-phosphopantetheinyl transferase